MSRRLSVIRHIEFEQAVARQAVRRLVSPQSKALRDTQAAPASSGAAGLGLLEAERRLLLSALEKTGWNQTKTAEVLGITRKQLRTRMKNHNLLPDPDRDA